MAGSDLGMEVQDLGVVGYGEALEMQGDLVRRRRAGEIPDQILLLQHPHVITLGSSAREENILFGAEERAARGIELFETGRGGDVTYHGPGQMVGYPVLDLKPDRQDLHRYIRDLEEVLIRAVGVLGVEGWREEGLTGVWTAGGKVAAIGVRVSSGWITSHGFALNISTDLSYFRSIVPCGIEDRPVTTLANELDVAPDWAVVRDAVLTAFQDVFDRVIE